MFDRMQEEHAERLAVFRRALARGDVSVVAERVEDWLNGHGIQLDHTSESFKTLAFRFLKIMVTATDKQAQRHLGEMVDTPPAPAPFGAALDKLTQPSATLGATPQPQATIPLGKAVDLYTQEKRQSGEWQNGTEYKEGAKVRLFAEIMGMDRDLGSLTIDDMRELKAALLRFPANRNKLAQYRDMTVAEVLKVEVPEEHRLQPTTLKNYFNKIGAFLKWAKKHRYHSDPTIASDILTIKATKQDHEHRSPLTAEDISRYFSPDTFPKATENSPAMFWVSVMGLFTGARLEELCQLYLSDIVEEDGVWCFAFRPDRPDKLMKNAASRRYTPIAPFLLEDLGFLAYVDKLKSEGEERLFPELTPHGSDNKYSHYLSRRLGAYRASIGLRGDASGGKKDFHSFRGTVAQWCEEHGVPEKLAARIIGHKYGKMTYGRYTTDTRPSVMLREVVARLDFGVDLGHLKRSPHVVKPGP
jgi:integrase